MSLNLNSGPYYDDFDPTKNYHRVLFKPGVAVQARELTQLQTILSDQLGQLGSFTLKEGAIISGCEQKLEKFEFIKILDTDSNTDPISNSDLASYEGATLVGGTTGIKAKIISHKTGQITVGDAIDTKAFYIVYNDGNAQPTYRRFEQAETLTVESSNASINGHTFVTQTTEDGTFGKRDFYAGVAPHLTLSPGIIYAQGNFIRTKNLSVFIDKFSPYTDKKIGFLVTEAIKQASVDNTLYDNASGSFNEGAPGADRLEHTVSLISYNRDATPADNYFQIATYSNGNITRAKIQTDPLGQIRETLAREAYDRHGNYVSKGMQVYFKEHLRTTNARNAGQLTPKQGGDPTKLILGVKAGNGSVAGYPIELLADQLSAFQKPSATQIEETVSQSTTFGNYVIVNDVCGAWDIDGADPAANGIVSLHSSVANGVSGGAYSDTVVPTTVVGTAKVRYIELSSGTPGSASAEYKLYLFDVKMISGEFGAVRSISYENSDANAFADIVLNSAGVAQLYEKNSNKYVWNLPYRHLKTLKTDEGAYRYNFKYIKEFDKTAAATINLALSGDESFFFGNGSVSSSNISDHIKLVAKAQLTIDGTTVEKGEFIDLDGLVTQNTEASLTINLGSSVSGSGEVRAYVNVQVENDEPITKSLVTEKFVKIQADTNENFASNKFCLGVPNVFKVTSIQATSNPDYTTGAREVSQFFSVDDGQRDNFYGLAYIEKKSSSTIDLTVEKYITVKFDYFDNGTIAGPTFACIDSYPVDDTGETGIRTEEIPRYVSTSGQVFDLRNAVDFRPSMQATVTPASTVAGVTGDDVNPSSFEKIKRPLTGLTNPIPTATFTTDLEFYLPEAYRVVIASSGDITIIKGNPSTSPKLPAEPEDSMTLATGYLPPYPCLSQQAAKIARREDLAMTIFQTKNKKYTMRDIGALEQRISNLEYYTTLTLLEKEAGKVTIADADGIDRFKNGYIVDSFADFGVMAVNHPDNNCSVDVKKREMRAAFSTSQIGFKPISGSTAGQSGYYWHVPFDEAIYTQQTQASSYRNVVGELFIVPPTNEGVEGQDPTETAPATEEDLAEETAASDVGTTPAAPSYYLIRSRSTVNEGGTFRITLDTRNVPEGTELGYTVFGTGITSADYTTVPTTASDGTGNFTVGADGSAVLDVTIANDLSTSEGDETWSITLSGIGISATTTVRILDTSVAAETTGSTPVSVPDIPTTAATGPWIGSVYVDPPVSNFIDNNRTPTVLDGTDGQYDHLLGDRATELGTTSGWSLQWSNWEFATSTIGADDPGKQFGLSADPANAIERGDGLYIPEYDATWVDPQTIPPNSSTVWETREAQYVWEDQFDVIEDVPVNVIMRQENVYVMARGLKPNTSHRVYINGNFYKTVTTSSLGGASFGVTFFPGDTAGVQSFEVINDNDASQVTSVARGTFTANHGNTADIRVKTTPSTRPQKPSEGIVEREVRSNVYADMSGGGTQGEARTKRIEQQKRNSGNPDPWVTTHSLDGQSLIRANRVPVDEVNFEDKVITVTCKVAPQVNGLDPLPGADVAISTVIMERPDGSRYGADSPDPNCATYDDFVSKREIPSVPNQGEVYTNIDTVDTGTVQNEVTRVVLTDDSNTRDTATGLVQTVDASQFTHEDANEDEVSVNTSETASSLGETNVRITTDSSSSLILSNTSVEVINPPNASSVSGIEDLNIDLKAIEALDFDFSNIDLCLGETGPLDPIAQSFFVEGMPGGMYATSIDIFFRNKSTEENNSGITLEVREMINGLPGPDIIAESHKTRSECFVSTEDSSGQVTFNSTNFKFEGPVYLKNNTEYCVVLRPDGNDRGYEVWIAKMGETRKGTTETITEQTHSGVLFTSANNRTWTPHQSEDMMFVVRRANFKANQEYTVNTVNKNIDWIKFDADEWDRTPNEALGVDDDGNPLTPPSYFTVGQNVHGFKFTINSAGAGYTDGTYDLVFTNTGTNGSGAAGTYVVSGGIVTSITLTNPGSGYTSAPTVALSNGDATTDASVSVTLNRATYVRYDRAVSTYELEVIDGSFAVGDMVGNGITFTKISAIEDRDLTTYVVQYHSLNPDEIGTIVPKIALTKAGSSTANTTYSDAFLRSTVELPEVKTVYSYSNEIARDGEKTARLQFTLSTPSNNVGPLLDLAALDSLLIENKINNTSAEEETRTGGDAQTKYITRKVVLAEGQDAEDLKVFLDNSIPTGTAVEVYAKLQSAEDDGEFLNDIYWRKLEVEEAPFIATSGVAEYTYKIPEKSTGSWGVNGDGVFEYDITRVASIPVVSGGTYASAPIIKITDDAGVGYGASAEAIMDGTTVSSIRITNPGRDYSAGNVNAQIVPGSGGEEVAGSLGTATTSTVTYKTYKNFSIKIVHLSDNRAVLPKTKSLRAYALQV